MVDGEEHPPTEEYLARVLKGYRDWSLPLSPLTDALDRARDVRVERPAPAKRSPPGSGPFSVRNVKWV